MVGKTFKGMSDDLLRWQTERFRALAIDDDGRVVTGPARVQVVEIALDGDTALDPLSGRSRVAVRPRGSLSRADKDAVETRTPSPTFGLSPRRVTHWPPCPNSITAPTEETVTDPVTDDGEHDRFAHYVRKADATRATVEGVPVRALCGKVWVPSRDPSEVPGLSGVREDPRPSPEPRQQLTRPSPPQGFRSPGRRADGGSVVHRAFSSIRSGPRPLGDGSRSCWCRRWRPSRRDPPPPPPAASSSQAGGTPIVVPIRRSGIPDLGTTRSSPIDYAGAPGTCDEPRHPERSTSRCSGQVIRANGDGDRPRHRSGRVPKIRCGTSPRSRPTSGRPCYGPGFGGTAAWTPGQADLPGRMGSQRSTTTWSAADYTGMLGGVLDRRHRSIFYDPFFDEVDPPRRAPWSTYVDRRDRDLESTSPWWFPPPTPDEWEAGQRGRSGRCRLRRPASRIRGRATGERTSDHRVSTWSPPADFVDPTAEPVDMARPLAVDPFAEPGAVPAGDFDRGRRTIRRCGLYVDRVSPVGELAPISSFPADWLDPRPRCNEAISSSSAYEIALLFEARSLRPGHAVVRRRSPRSMPQFEPSERHRQRARARSRRSQAVDLQELASPPRRCTARTLRGSAGRGTSWADPVTIPSDWASPSTTTSPQSAGPSSIG